MARDPLLRDAVKAIKSKILTGAEIATPEELAYLGSAVNNIGGRATVLEVEEMGDIKIAEITAHADATETETIKNITTAKNAAEDFITTTKNQACATVTAAKEAGIAAANANLEDVITRSNAQRDEVMSTTTAFKEKAFEEVAVAGATVTQQMVFGARSYFYCQL